MTLFSTKLDQLEARLKTLIEGRFARLLPVYENRDDFIHRLVSAMETGTQVQPNGISLAPDIYVLLVHPDMAPEIETNPQFLEELAIIILEVGASTGLVFAQPPVVNLSPNPDLDRNSVVVIARISQDMLAKTIESPTQSGVDNGNIPPNAFLIVNGVENFVLDQPLVNIGRRSNNDLVINDPRISRSHAQLRAIRGKYVIFDLDSKGGTYINGQRVPQRTLHSKDVISLAGVPLVYGQDDIYLGQTQEISSTPPIQDDETLPQGSAV
jgi:hypothetical protein